MTLNVQSRSSSRSALSLIDYSFTESANTWTVWMQCGPKSTSGFIYYRVISSSISISSMVSVSLPVAVRSKTPPGCRLFGVSALSNPTSVGLSVLFLTDPEQRF